MEITRNVILDLLPLYLSNEVSADTRTLVEKYLKNDPQLAKIAEQSSIKELQENIPIPLTEDDKMKAYRKTRRLMVLFTVILASFISVVLFVIILIMFFSSSS